MKEKKKRKEKEKKKIERDQWIKLNEINERKK